MRKTLRSVICAVMVLVMMLTMAPSYAFAEGNDEGVESSQADTAQETLESGEAETAEETDSETVAETTEKEQKTKEEQNTNEEDEKVKATETETEVTNEIESQTQSDPVESSESIVGNQKDDAVDEDSEAIVETVEDTKTETEKETITENKKETEEENNIPKTEFQYVDDCVTITANAPAEANLPQDAELRADYLEPGSDEYNNAVTAIDAQLSEQLRAEQGNTAVDYVLYDIYFVSASDDKRIEPEDGKVTVKMTIHDLQEATEDGKIINKDVVHLKNDGVAEIVTDYINTNGKGEVTSMGFTQSSFSIVGGAVTHSENNTEPADVSEKLNDFLTSAEFGEEGEGGTVIVQENGSYEIELAFKEQEYLQLNNDGTLVYTFPKGFVPAECSDQNIIFDVSDSNGNVYRVSGTYSVKGQDLSIRINTEDENYHVLTAAANVEFDMKLTMTITDDATNGKIDFGGGVIKDVVVNTNHDLSVEKSGTYNKSEGKFEYTIRVVSTGKNSNVVITDSITGTLLKYNNDLTVESSLGTEAVSGSVELTENGFTYTEEEMQHGEVLTLKYSADIDYSKLTNSNEFTAEQTGNTVTVKSSESEENEDSYDFRNQIAYDRVSKSSTDVDIDKIDEQIVSWEIVLNPDCKVAAGGKKVTDTISEDSQNIMHYTGNGITVTRYNAKGNEVGKPQEISWTELNVAAQTATGWSWTIPEEDTTPYKYVITYNTVVDGSDLWQKQEGPNSVTNNVEFDGEKTSGSANVEPGNTWDVSKGHTSASSSSRTVDWVITVDVAAEGFGTFKVKDTLPSTWVNNGEDSVLYLHRLVGNVEVTGLQEGESYDLTYDNVTNNKTIEGYSNSAFTLTFYQDSDKKTSGLQESSSGRNRTLTIEFTTEYPEGWTENSAHTNSVNVHTEHGDKGANDSLTLTTQKIVKSCKSSGSDLSNDKQPYVEYHVAISGVDSDTVTVKDCFDTDIFELAYKQIYAQHGNYSWDTNQGYTSLSDCEVDCNQTDQGIEFTFTPEKDSNGQYFPWYGFCYQLRVREGVSDELIKQALDNNGSGSSRNTAYFGEEEAYADWNYTYNPVGKSIITSPTQGNNYTAEFKIVVNSDGVTMHNGEDFEVVDTLKNLQYIYDSVTVKIDDEIQADYETTLGEDDDGNDTLTWTVPDNTRIEITYKAKVQGTGSVTYSNTVSILDKYKSETGDQHVSVEYGGSGSGSSYSLKIVKVDANDPNKRLEGAVFELLTYYNGTSNNDPAKSEPVKLKDSTGNDLNISFGETDKNGEVTVESNQEKNGWALWPGRLYCLHEVTAPEGYKAGGNYLFYIPTGNQGEIIPQNCTLVGGNGEQILIENEESETETTSVTFSGTKTIEGIESTDKVFSFSLYETGKDYEIADDEAAKETISTKGTITGKQTISFSPIEYDSTGDYYYVIRENTLDEPDGFSIDETEYKIKVTVSEDQNGNLTANVEGVTSPDKIDFTNYYAGETSIKVIKVWKDGDNQDGKRPDSIKVQLYADGKAQGEPVVLNDKNYWSHTWSELDEKSAGNTIKYTVKEVGETGGKIDFNGAEYQVTYAGDATTGYTITNSYTPETTKVSGSKTWDDANNQDGKRPESIKINLLANGKKADEKTVSADDNWSWSFTNLPKYENGRKITYTITEDAVPDYTIEIDGYDVTNSYTPGKTSVTVTKSWNDTDNQDGKRPENIQVQLYADGKAQGEPVVLNAGNYWSHTWSELDEKSAGNTIKYTVKEVGETGGKIDFNGAEYQVTYAGDATTGYTITNSYTPETTKVSGSKTWDDVNNRDGKRPESIKINLLANGKKADEKTVSADDNWSWSFTNLPKYENGRKITYTITEDAVPDYTIEIDGYDVTNSYTPGKTSVTVTKSWNDTDNQDGKRPENIQVQLYADGKAQGEPVVLNAGNYWSHTWSELDEKSAGNTIKYTVKEVGETGGKIDFNGAEYQVTYAGDATTGYTITNSYTPETTEVTGSKTWDDANNQDGKRPTSITINLLANGVQKESKKVTEEDNWSWSFTNLPKYENGAEITYTITEDAVPDYTIEIDGYDVINSYTPGKTSVTVTKSWNDADDQDGKRPDSIQVQLYADGKAQGEPVVLNVGNHWSHTWSGLDEKTEGKEVEYTVKEVREIGGKIDFDGTEYQVSYTGDATTGYTITNAYASETTEVSGSKTWDDNNDQDGRRPEYITINLFANGEKVDEKTVSADDNWSWSFTNLPKYENGAEIIYTITEDRVPNYTTAVNDYDVTNTYTPGKTSISVIKRWNDANDQDGKRPDSIQVQLYADGEKQGEPVVLNVENRWSHTWSELNEKSAGNAIKYTVKEVGETDGKIDFDGAEYQVTYSGDAETGYTITNSYTPEKTKIPVTKKWKDNNDQDGIRPNTVTVNLLANGKDIGESLTLNSANNWSGSFTNLAKYKDGEEIIYTVEEVGVEGYEAVIEGNMTAGYVITNSHIPETTEVSGSKTWDDANNQDGKRPESITINLFANGEKADEKTVSADDNWSWSFTNLPKYENGRKITYTITEDAVPDYTTVVNNYDVTNSYTPGKTSVTVTKNWDDAGNQDGKRPDSIQVQLYADGEELGEPVVLNAETRWSHTWSDLDEKAGGKTIEYTVKEVGETDGKIDFDGAEYQVTYTGNATAGYTITNSYTSETTEVSGSKTWDDANNQDGKRPASIKINLLANGEKVDEKTVGADNNWSWNFTDLPKYENGTEISYTITEDQVDGYSTIYNEYDVINSYTPGKTSVTVTKNWQDSNDQDGIRPNEITVKLLANGKDTGKTLTLNETNNWEGSFTELAEHENGEVIEYTVEEVSVEGYETVITGNMTEGYVITNSHTSETIEVSGSKTWDDEDDQDGKRPDSITIRLLANGTEVAEKAVSADDNWSWSFTNLPKYENGTEIIYTITEDAVLDYTTEINGYDVTNTYKPGKTSVSVTKSWEDAGDRDGKRPESIQVQLYADGKTQGEPVVLNAENKWSHTWSELDEKSAGNIIEYTVKEVGENDGNIDFDGAEYQVAYAGDAATGYTIINSYITEKVEVSGSKTWDDKGNEGARPESITIRLYADNKEIDRAAVTAENDWSWSFENLPKYRDGGQEIIYTISEDAVKNYITEVDGYDVTNKYQPGKTGISVAKRWDDSDNRDGKRPDSVRVQLYADGEAVGDPVALNKSNDWRYTWSEQDKQADGKEILYTVKEVGEEKGTIDFDGTEYKVTYTGNAEKGYTITNSYNAVSVGVQTGDNTNMASNLAVMFAAMAAAGAVMIFRRRRYKE